MQRGARPRSCLPGASSHCPGQAKSGMLWVGEPRREALTTWAVQEDLTEAVTWSWGLKEEQEFASQRRKGSSQAGGGAEAKAWRERERGGPAHPNHVACEGPR